MRRLLAILIPGLLLLTACGGSPSPEPTSQSAGETAKLDSVKVTDNGDKKAPGVDFAKPLEVAEATVKVVAEGGGDRVKAGQTISVSFIALDGKDGKALGDSYDTEPEAIELNDEFKAQDAVLYNAFVGTKVGSQLGYAVPSQAQTGEASKETRLFILKVTSVKDSAKVLDKPEGETVTPPAGLPTVKVNDKGIPEISVEGVSAPTQLIAQDLIKGSGPAVTASNTLTVNYVGVNLVGGVKFDSSFDRGQPASFPLTGVIKGWTQGLAGKTVGSRVLLVIPKDLAYGEAGQGEAKGDLVFVVDILGAK
ncbi:FKBP-type peptidyl-prolyl cis-trans isomerase [Arthrobacter sp. CJ23]|uniref:FKBP-type peptidyl-prolyl cis-trans isomerase n=1 Tax=Arthrobacter sp. CJ23 TaxID=2972479 RepID=UPI00215C2BAD|nr:FKBP-type peptidyl-prolyl cis-trans isomerase [Arthrobacter sp. CJ23]UVJ37740.1 FKBP-type peptidyl-prolyl cis-trans isomerase [Arthrobacter sp. CJ23]